MKASPYFEGLATAHLAGGRLARRSAVDAHRAEQFAAAGGAQALLLRATVRLLARAAPGVDLRALRRHLAWQRRSKPKAAATVATPVASTTLVRQIAPLHMFALSRVERLVQQTSIHHVLKQTNLLPFAVVTRGELPTIQLVQTPPAVSGSTTVQQKIEQHIAPLRQIWLRSTAVSLVFPQLQRSGSAVATTSAAAVRFAQSQTVPGSALRAADSVLSAPAAAAQLVQAPAMPVPATRVVQSSAAPSTAMQVLQSMIAPTVVVQNTPSQTSPWLAPRLQRISHHHMHVIGREPAARAAATPVSGRMADTRSRSPLFASASTAAQHVAAPVWPAAQRSTGSQSVTPAVALVLQQPVTGGATALPLAVSQLAGQPLAMTPGIVLPSRPRAMYYPTSVRSTAVQLPAGRIAKSLQMRANRAAEPATASASVPVPATHSVFGTGGAPLPWQAAPNPLAAAATAVALANAQTTTQTAGPTLVSATSDWASSLPNRGNNPFVAGAATPDAASPRPAQSAAEPEWVQAVQRVIFTRHVLDKVADDVVAKIEKRVRIERERRGI